MRARVRAAYYSALGFTPYLEREGSIAHRLDL
ncbi:hypothetical protein BKA08_001005 [Nocardioides marinisabuli]|uniref:Uncharacterized protein n=1 Tax=Nocardioides marinisabuli TaxID=419476 RepID=A0A7Y9JP92_9ACTN|nr:hypothetical protein [Nocardioides marinisabuli]